MGVAYFIRPSGDGWSVIRLHPDNREEIVQSGITLIEAEILCAIKLEDIPKPASQRAPEDYLEAPECTMPRRHIPRQLTFKF